MTTTTPNIDEELLNDPQRMKNLRLFDHAFFTLCMKGCNEAVQYVLRIILDKPDLIVEDSRLQEMDVSPTDKSVVLQVMATDSSGRIINIAMHCGSPGISPEGTRYIRSRIDLASMNKGQKLGDPANTDLYVISITEEDCFHKVRPVYRFRMMDTVNHKELEDGGVDEVIYVNGSWDKDDEIGLLTNDFRVCNPAQMRPGILRKRAEFFKTTAYEEEITSDERTNGRIL